MGVAQAAQGPAAQRLRSRVLFGRKLGEMQYWQYKLAEHATELEAARAMYQKAAVRLDRGDRPAGGPIPLGHTNFIDAAYVIGGRTDVSARGRPDRAGDRARVLRRSHYGRRRS
ncbi:acyl-CoA dehydrogenase family protein [Nocardia anaemiae]|uniref:acyl-CoA dehydrogenase family protein n=1 Tax=Nocardia anaemiae TaxID=263910 RepID=UPI0027D8F1E0|nr:acyl-CoA dehydrogenase family protein [Nocardia anaemiae]